METVADTIAPGNPLLGIMLPYTPLHHLLLEAMSPVPLIMTSGNVADEPIAYRDDEALERLAGVADLFLAHDRPIHVRCDDSVTRVFAGRDMPVRRSRGSAPAPVRLPLSCREPILAVGSQLKATFALGCGSQVFVSHHLGDLDHLEAHRAFERDVALYEELFGVEPKLIAHDLHPDYASTRYAAATGLPKVPVQHHHAHLASCMAEHGLTEPAIGVIFDGAGLGTDGAIWGGEFLVGDYRSFQRAAHLRYVAMPGGEQAAKEPWRMAVSHLQEAECDSGCSKLGASPSAMRAVMTMLERRLNAPLTSSMGRLFDAVSAIAGIRTRSSYEGQAAIELEYQAMRVADARVYSWEVSKGSSLASWIIDTRPLIRDVARDAADGVSPAVIARRFHSTVVEWIADVCSRIRVATGVAQVVLSGGVFMNSLLTGESVARLTERGFNVYTQQKVPANDGGLSLGQLIVAAQSPG
jgi:hydrogenase maturation protein HypF